MRSFSKTIRNHQRSIWSRLTPNPNGVQSTRRTMQDYIKAAQDFRRARNRAVFHDLLARLTGQPTELLSYEEVRQKLRTSGVASQSIQEVPLKDIVGSVGRYTDFTRSFLPRRSSDKDRWVGVMVANEDLSGLPPVDLYLIDEAYFVVDGHHRVSVAKDIGANTIQAYVTEIRSSVPLSADASKEDLILRAGYADFIRRTQMHTLRPTADFMVSEAGQYGKLLEHIEVHRYFMGIDIGREISNSEAVSHWYDTVYLPVVDIIRDLGILNDFPSRTEADLYLWISKHRADVADYIEWDVDYAAAASDIAEQQGTRWQRLISRVGQREINVASSDQETSLPTTDNLLYGQKTSAAENLFNDILVPISGLEIGWIALDQALTVAARESGRILGLHIHANEDEPDEARNREIEAGFYWRCGERQVDGKMVFTSGPIARSICARARWVDIVVVKLQYPPGSSALARYSSGITRMIRGCTRPLLVVAGDSPTLNKPMILWEGGKRSRLPAMIAAYVSGKWDLPLVVLANDGENNKKRTKLKKLRRYLSQYDLNVTYVRGAIDKSDEILKIAHERECDWIITAGYGSGALKEIVFGELLDELLGLSNIPILICR